MKRFLSVWLPRWPIERRYGWIAARNRSRNTDGPLPHEVAPLVLSTLSENGPRIAATNAVAGRLGLHAGMKLADARAIHPSLWVEPADMEGDGEALLRLALWGQCYSPLTRIEAPDGLSIDITGCAHLFGGEEGLVEGLAGRLEGFGLTARLAVAPTIGAAWAMARHGADDRAILAPDTLRDHLAPLPVAALRLEEGSVAALARLGLKQIGDLYGKPRAPLVARFGREPVRRLDQALGIEDESFQALTPPPAYRVERRFAEPLVVMADIECVAARLTRHLAESLEMAGKGARRVELLLFGVDGRVERLEIRTSAASRDADHLMRLLNERLDGIRDDTGFGFELVVLNAFDIEDVAARQDGFAGENGEGEAGELAPLLDRFVNRFGARSVARFAPRASHVPERAVQSVSVLGQDVRHDWQAHAAVLLDGAPFGRPLLLFDMPEPVTALSEIPDGPPVRFEWRRVSHHVVRADGPERIAPEWWRAESRAAGGTRRQTRDYYRIEDEAGRRFWLYRDGLYERQRDLPRWFIHGVFA